MLILLSPAASGFAESLYYQWVDEYGRTQLSDQPPPKGVNYAVRHTASLPHVHRMQSVRPGTVYPDTSKRRSKGGKISMVGMAPRLGDRDKPNWNCRQVKKKLDNIERQMRRGYTAAQESRLRRQKNKYRDYDYSECR